MGQNNRQFLTAIARCQILRTQVIQNVRADFTKNFITGLMSIVIIDLFKSVNIRHEQCQRITIALTFGN